MFLYDGTETSKEFTALYSWWVSLLVLQLLSITWFTGRIRVRTETIHSEEDRMWLKNPTVKLHINGGGHPEVDHIRAGHLNDLAIIIPYLIIALIWLETLPSSLSANIILRVFPIAKIVETALYSKVIDAPEILKHICLAVSYSVIIYMIVSCFFVFYG